MEKVQELVKGIKESLTQSSASNRDEVEVMKHMLNDKDYKVDVYGKDGQIEGTYCPAESARLVASNIIQGTTKMSSAEAEELASNYEFKRKDAVELVELSKEFINTYLDTGRKIKLGDRAQKSITLSQKDKEVSTRTFPRKVGVADDGSAIYKTDSVEIPAYKEVKATSRPKY